MRLAPVPHSLKPFPAYSSGQSFSLLISDDYRTAAVESQSAALPKNQLPESLFFGKMAKTEPIAGASGCLWS